MDLEFFSLLGSHDIGGWKGASRRLKVVVVSGALVVIKLFDGVMCQDICLYPRKSLSQVTSQMPTKFTNQDYANTNSATL